VIIFVALSALGVLVHPLSFVCVLAVLGVYMYLFLQNPTNLRLGPFLLTVRTKRAVFGLTTGLFLWMTSALSILGTWAFFSAAISIVHAGARISVKEPDFESDSVV
jgi:ribose/xylose/arabinose/galactoside ABC-type transport system permease subunit